MKIVETHRSAVDSAMARFSAPPDWRVLRCSGRLEARWAAPDGRWARYSVLLEPGDAEPQGEVFFQRAVGGEQLTVTFSSSDLSRETMAAASELLTPLQYLLARAG